MEGEGFSYTDEERQNIQAAKQRLIYAERCVHIANSYWKSLINMSYYICLPPRAVTSRLRKADFNRKDQKKLLKQAQADYRNALVPERLIALRGRNA